MPPSSLLSSQTILLLVDLQEKVFNPIVRKNEVLASVFKVVKGFQILNLPVMISEQYPEGLGPTLSSLRSLLGDSYHPWTKTTFSCVDDPAFFKYMISQPYQQWVIAGVETHICVLQTAKSLLKAGKQVTVLSDATSSRSIDDFLISIAEMREEGVRISSSETILFELLKDATHPQFKQISHLIKTTSQC